MTWRSPYWVQDLQGRWHSGCGNGLDTACDIPIAGRMMDTVRVGQPPDPSALMCQICLEKNMEEKSVGQRGDA